MIVLFVSFEKLLLLCRSNRKSQYVLNYKEIIIMQFQGQMVKVMSLLIILEKVKTKRSQSFFMRYASIVEKLNTL